MSNSVPVFAAAAGELIAYFILGGLLPLAAKGEKKSLAETVCAGFIVAHAVAEAVSVAGVLSGMTLTVFCQLLSVVLSVLMSISICINFSSIYRGTSSVSGGLSLSLPVFSVVLLSTAVTALAVLSPAPGDPTHIISQMTADIYSDTMGLRVPGSGAMLNSLPTSSVLVRFYAVDTMVCRMTGISAVTEMKSVRTCVVSIISCMITFRIFYRMFESDDVKASVAAFAAIIAGAFFRTPYTPYGMLYTSGWTGKTTLAVIMIPVLFLLAQAMCDHPDNFRLYLLLALSGVTAVSLCGSALLIWPMAMAACVTGAAFAARNPRLLLAIPAGAAIPGIVILIYLNTMTLPAL